MVFPIVVDGDGCEGRGFVADLFAKAFIGAAIIIIIFFLLLLIYGG